MELNGRWNLFFREEENDTFDTSLPSTEGWKRIDATVPGNVEIDLTAAGIEKDPFLDEHIYDYRKYEEYEWLFERTFSFDGNIPEGTDAVLSFEGIDTYSDVFLNGTLLGSTEDMHMTYDWNVSDKLLTGENTLSVHIKSTMYRAQKEEFYPVMSHNDQRIMEASRCRKAQHMFGWDIMPRLVSAGIYRDVDLNFVKKERIDDYYLAFPDAGEDSAWCVLFTHINHVGSMQKAKWEIVWEGSCGDSHFKKAWPMHFVAEKFSFGMNGLKLWYPKGLGEPNMYDMTLSVLKDGEVWDEKHWRQGIRSVKTVRTYDQRDKNRFDVYVNHKKILLLGTNIGPVDALHSRDRARLPELLDLLDKSNSNAIRLWGGDVYEDISLFRFCSEHGILVWQDLAFACAVYPDDEKFIRLVEAELKEIIRKYRNETSLFIWSGNNECDEVYGWYGMRGNENTVKTKLDREIVANMVRRYDPYREYLPSSPYIPYGLTLEEEGFVPDRHVWGSRDYFKSRFYSENPAAFVSEYGHLGCPSLEEIEQYTDECVKWPIGDRTLWWTHATDDIRMPRKDFRRLDHFRGTVKTFFSDDIERDLESFVYGSEYYQAESFKYYIERTRLRRDRMGGILVWKFNNGWPETSSCCVDYTMHRLPSFEYTRLSQQEVCIVGDLYHDWNQDFFIDNNGPETKSGKWKITRWRDGAVMGEGSFTIASQSNRKIFSTPLRQDTKEYYIMEWETEDGKKGINHYLTGTPAYDYDEYHRFYTEFMAKVNSL